MRRIARISLLSVAALALAVGAATPGVGQSPSVPVPPAPSPWQTRVVIIVQLTEPGGGLLTPEQVAAAESVVRARLVALGVPGAIVEAIPDDRLRIEVADETWADAVRNVATAPGVIQFVPIPNAYADAVADGEPLPPGMPAEPLFGPDGIAEASVGTDQLDGPAVNLVLTAEAARLFDEYAAAHFGERFAIVRDGIVISAPSINARSFNGQAQISGPFDLPAVAALVAILRGGLLPVTAEIVNLCPAASRCPGASPEPGSSAES